MSSSRPTRAHTHTHESRVSVAHVLRRSALHVRVACPRCMSALCKSACDRVLFQDHSASPRASCVAGGSPRPASPRASVLRTRVALPAPPRCLLPARALPPQCLQPARQTKALLHRDATVSSMQRRPLVPHYNPPVPPPISRPAALHDRALHAAMHERLNLLMRSASGSPPSPHPLSAFSLRAKPKGAASSTPAGGLLRGRVSLSRRLRHLSF